MTPAVIETTSSNFCAKDADFYLVSSDQVKFAVHKTNLVACSALFQDMCALSDGQEKRPIVTVTEVASTLEIILPYAYPDRRKPFVLDFPETWKIVNAFEKYEISRGSEAIIAAFWKARESKELDHNLYALMFARRVQASDLVDVVLPKVMSHELSLDVLERMMTRHKGQVHEEECANFIIAVKARRSLLAYCLHPKDPIKCSNSSLSYAGLWQRYLKAFTIQEIKHIAREYCGCFFCRKTSEEVILYEKAVTGLPKWL